MFIRVAAFRSAIVLTAASVRAFGSSASAQSSTATSFPVLATSAAQSQMAKETATVAGGCFWCIEAVYNEMAGVESAISGYIGGKNANPTYEQARFISRVRVSTFSSAVAADTASIICTTA